MAKIRRQNAPRRLQDAHKTAQEALRPPPGRPPDAQDASKPPPRDAPRGPQDDPKTPQDGPKMAPRRSEDALRTAQDPPRRPQPPQDSSKMLRSRPQPLPDNDFGTILKGLYKIFTRFFGRLMQTCHVEPDHLQRFGVGVGVGVVIRSHATPMRCCSFRAAASAVRPLQYRQTIDYTYMSLI